MNQLKKADGTDYRQAECILQSRFSAVMCKRIGKGDLDKDSEHQGFRDVERAKMKILKSAGKGNRPHQALPISEAEEQMLYDASQFGLTGPDALQRTLWWHTTVLFGHRRRDESLQLKRGAGRCSAEDGFFRGQLPGTAHQDQGRASREAGLSTPEPLKMFGTPQRCPIHA